MVINPNGSFDRECLKNMEEWHTNKALPDGTPVNSIGIIMPNRKSALKIQDEVSSKDIRIIYIDDSKIWWTINSEGLWLDEQ